MEYEVNNFTATEHEALNLATYYTKSKNPAFYH
jgi:hypothetical protein